MFGTGVSQGLAAAGWLPNLPSLCNGALCAADRCAEMWEAWRGPQVPVWLLKATRSLLRSFQWARDAADRLVLPCCVVLQVSAFSRLLRLVVERVVTRCYVMSSC